MAKADYCVFVGRFQPFHNAHLRVCLNALQEAEQLIVVIGSYRTSKTIRNPWNFEQRRALLLKSLPEEARDRVHVVPLRDYMYNDNTWITNLQSTVGNIVGEAETNQHRKTIMIGHFKDDSSYYLEYFPQWKLIAQPNFYGIDATEIRRMMYEGDDMWQGMINSAIVPDVKEFMKTEEFENLKREHEYIKRYQEKWKSAPFKPTFVTTDAVVVKSGHVLVVRRKMNPGKGQFALPGGFIGDQPIFDSAVRELYEETNIRVPKDVMKNSMVECEIFDHPRRSLRGRTVTHAYLFRLDHKGPLPSVVGDDDAAEAVWMPLSDIVLNETNFFEDHIHIINHFVQRV